MNSQNRLQDAGKSAGRQERRPVLFITWALECSRSDAIARHLGGRSFMVYYSFLGSRYSTILLKYFSQTVKTLAILLKERPRYVFVMSPPVVACLGVWIYARLAGADFIIDAHSAAFLDSRWRAVLFLHRFFSRRALATVVTNRYLEEIVHSWGARATIVRDVPVPFGKANVPGVKGSPSMTFISSFTPDEPLEIFLSAAARLPHIQFYVTGDYRAAPSEIIRAKPANVEFTGFLSKPDYVGRLVASDAVICLTTLDHTMQRGAYEAVYLGKPVVTTDSDVLREAFYKGAVHVDNTVDGIVEGVKQMYAHLDRHNADVLELRTEKLNAWFKVEAEFRRLFGYDADEKCRICATQPA